MNALSDAEKAELRSLDGDEVAIDRWFEAKAVAFMRERPRQTVVNGLRKLGAAFSWLPNPRRSFWPTVAYLLSFGPIALLGASGMARSLGSWREHCLIYGLFASFIAITAVFFAHTSHRSFLDVYLIGYAASVLAGWKPLARQSVAGGNPDTGRDTVRESR